MEISSLAMIPMSDYHCHFLPVGTNAAVKSHIPDVFVQTKKFGRGREMQDTQDCRKMCYHTIARAPLSRSTFFE